MSNVTLEIGGRRYTVACAAGEESHIAMLGASINGKLATIPNLGAQSEQRTLLFAALLLADELHEANKAPAAPEPEANTAEPLEKLADRLESLASQLEASLPTS
ncbi:MAG: cell division protein ZapA [Alteraurantiacibacter sp.]